MSCHPCQKDVYLTITLSDWAVLMKLVGPQLLANGHVQLFVKFVRLTVVCTLLLVPLIVGTAVPFTYGLSYSYGANACGYAKNAQCVPFFNSVFGPNASGGTYTLPFTFSIFPLGACAEAVFFVLRSILLTLVDLDYMVRCTVVAVVAYVPAIVVVSAVYGNSFGGRAISYFVAMYLPQAILCVLFLARIHVVVARMLKKDAAASADAEEGGRDRDRVREAPAPS
jgi:hypothetical protein